MGVPARPWRTCPAPAPAPQLCLSPATFCQLWAFLLGVGVAMLWHRQASEGLPEGNLWGGWPAHLRGRVQRNARPQALTSQRFSLLWAGLAGDTWLQPCPGLGTAAGPYLSVFCATPIPAPLLPRPSATRYGGWCLPTTPLCVLWAHVSKGVGQRSE